ncbi:MAG: SDR family NAD(P)-dependent oxidoreductase [Pseudomonadales bacterium]
MSIHNMLDLTGKVAVVTGASRSIGSAVTKRLAEAGAKTVVHYYDDFDNADGVRKHIRNQGGEAILCKGDLSGEDGASNLIDKACSAFGSLDILINNAGIYPNKPFLDLTLGDWRAMYAANVETAFLCTKLASDRMKAAGGGAIVNIGSLSALHPSDEHAHYSSSKAAIVSFTRAAAQELGVHGIRVNAVSPGLISRPGIEEQWPEGVGRWQAKAPLKRVGEPADIADACLYLVSPLSQWVSGHNLVVDGGISAANIY